MRHFPDLIETYLEYTKGHESTLRVRKWSFISVLAALLERKVWLPRGYYTLFPNLYTFIIGKSGLIKKTTSTGIAVNLAREVDGLRIMAERLTANALVEQLALSGRRVEINGKLVNQSAVFAYASELSVFLTEVFGSITELLTTFYDCVPNDSSKPWVYGTVGRGERKVYGPCLNILGASTKAWLTKCIPRSEMEGGFTSRIIFVVEHNLPDKLVSWPELEKKEEEIREKLVMDLQSLYEVGGQITPTPEAKKYFDKWYTHHMRKVLPMNSDPRMIGYMSRKGDTILKLAIVRHLSKSSELVIDESDVEWAKNEMDELEPDWRMAFDGLGSVTSLAHEMLQYVTSRMKVRKGELIRHFAQFFPPHEITKAIHELKEMEEMGEWWEKVAGEKLEYYCVPGWNEIAAGLLS